ncbi:MAG: glucan biosynthesis protein [Gammaproteobacteria bacterium]
MRYLWYCGALLVLGIFPIDAAFGDMPAAEESSKPFDLAAVERRAQALAGRPYVPMTQALPEFLAALDYGRYRDIRFRSDKSVWFGDGLPFQLQFFHRGGLYKDRIAINLIEHGVSRAVPYSPGLFDFGENELPRALPPDLGFAGFRIHCPQRTDGPYDEFVVFQGASYFRAVGRLGPVYAISHPVYGISARGLALDTGFAEPEEFPVFKEFWIEKPEPEREGESAGLTVFALLDGPSVAGAYRFVIHPGSDLSMEVKARLFLRKGVRRFGIAPLTSMFFHGEHSDRHFDDFRPEVHDSDGLLIATRGGEWVWRPLNNPRRLATNVFEGTDVLGFGLMQRDRSFANYQDLASMYHARPSIWVEPVGKWGPGSVYLIEIPSDAEYYDNMVAFFVPDKTTAHGQAWTFDYRLKFLVNSSPAPPGGKAISTRAGASGAGRLDSSKRKFVIDFAGERLRDLSPEARVEPVLTASSGRIIKPEIYKNLITGSWRLVFEFAPDPRHDPVDFRAYLRLANETLTETWIHQWSKP